jgi:hypothetical protein
VVTLVSNATQEFLRDLLEKLSLVAEHRKNSVKVQCFDLTHTQPPRDQSRFTCVCVWVWVWVWVCVCVQEDQRHTQVTDVRAQLHFLEQVEVLKRRRQEEELRETLLRLARVSSQISSKLTARLHLFLAFASFH